MANIFPVRAKPDWTSSAMKRMPWLIENFLHFLEVVGRRNDDTAFAHDRLSDKRSNVIGGGESDRVFDGFGALASAFFGIVSPLRTIDVGRGREGSRRSVRTAALFASHVAGNAERAPTASVKAGVEGDELMLAAVKPRELHGAFDGLRAAIAEKCFGQSARSDVGDLLG